MWSHLGARNLIDLQRAMALRAMGEKAKELYDEGYHLEADRVLDEMNERRRSWEAEGA